MRRFEENVRRFEENVRRFEENVRRFEEKFAQNFSQSQQRRGFQGKKREENFA